MKFAALMMALILGASVAASATAPQEQASHLAVPEAVLTIESAVTVSVCGKLVGLVLTDSIGGLHPVALTPNMSELEVRMNILGAIDASRILGVIVPCGAKDGTPLG